MKKLLFTLLFLSLASPALAQQSTPGENYGKWMTFYYQDKDSSQTGEFMKWVQTSRVLEEKPNAVPPMAAFFSIIFAQNAASVPGWLSEAEFSGHTKKAIEIALWLAGNQAELRKFATDASIYESTTPPNLATAPAPGAADIDMMWGAFSASGDTVYVNKVIDALESPDLPTRQAAQWSLESTMQRHPLVKQTIEAQAKLRTGVIKKKLEELAAGVSAPVE